MTQFRCSPRFIRTVNIQRQQTTWHLVFYDEYFVSSPLCILIIPAVHGMCTQWFWVCVRYRCLLRQTLQPYTNNTIEISFSTRRPSPLQGEYGSRNLLLFFLLLVCLAQQKKREEMLPNAKHTFTLEHYMNRVDGPCLRGIETSTPLHTPLRCRLVRNEHFRFAHKAIASLIGTRCVYLCVPRSLIFSVKQTVGN